MSARALKVFLAVVSGVLVAGASLAARRLSTARCMVTRQETLNTGRTRARPLLACLLPPLRLWRKLDVSLPARCIRSSYL